MLFENIKKILEKSKEKKVDLLVARDMLTAEQPENGKKLAKASEVLKYYYNVITKLWNDGDTDTIAEICELYEAEKVVELRKLIDKVKNNE